MSSNKGIPENVKDQLKTFHNSLNTLKLELQHYLDNEKEIRDEAAKDPETQASLDLTICYTVNSLYWMYLIACGQNPKDHDIRLELERVRKHMKRLTEIRDRKLRPQLNQKTSGSFVRNALFDPKNVKNKHQK